METVADVSDTFFKKKQKKLSYKLDGPQIYAKGKQNL
jgi:hypothetical protein